MKEHGDHIESRLKKLRDLKEAGVEPFAGAFEVQDSAAEVIKLHGDSPREKLEESPARCSLAGRLVAMRAFGKAAFAHLDDGSGKLQVYFKKDFLGDDYLIVKKLDVGDIVGVRGKLFRTKTDELTLEVDELKLLTKSVRPLPEKWHGLKDVELRYRQRYLDLIVNAALPRPHRKPRGEGDLPQAKRHHKRDKRVPRVARLHRGGDPHDAEHPRGRGGKTLPDAPQRPRHRPLPEDRAGALFEEAAHRRLRPHLRA
jgi:hypothetical protein